MTGPIEQADGTRGSADPALEAETGHSRSGPDRAFARAVAMAALRRLGEIDQILDRRLQKAPPAPVRTILRMAAWEILYEEEIPGPVAINEAVNLANRFSEPTSGRFVNGVLGTILRRKQAENP